MEILLAIQEALQGSLFEIGVLAILLLIFILVFFLTRGSKETELYRQLEAYLPILDTGITTLIRQVADNDEEVDYESERAAKLGIDPRMLYVLEKMENWVQKRGLDLEFEELYLRAEGIFNDMRDNGKLE